MLTPPEIARSLLAAGESKARLPFGKMLLLAILAGAYIALAGVGATAAAVTVESGSLAKLLSACVFPAGLSMVILAGSELFHRQLPDGDGPAGAPHHARSAAA